MNAVRRHVPASPGPVATSAGSDDESRPVPASSRRATHLSLLLVAMIWGGNFVAIKTMLRDLAPLDVAFVRGMGAAGFFILTLLLTGNPRLRMPRADWVRLVAVGLIGVTVLNVAIVFGQSLLSAALASLIVTSNPIHTAIISRLVLGEPLTRRKLGGIALAFVGLVIVLRWGAAGGAGFGTGHIRGVLILAIAPFSWAIYTVLSKPLLQRHSPVHVAGYSTVIGALAFLAIPFLRPGTLDRIADLPARGWLAATFATLISFVLAYVLWYRGLRVLSPSQTAVYIYLVPVFGLLSAWLILGEEPTLFLLLGGATILTGVIVTNTGAPRPKDTAPTSAPANVPASSPVVRPPARP
ncbi:MAG: Permease of the drug/metabolite transporter (DMT) superfamily [uncultured Thermomicrobiales bacterium]|uniref:Permease of the drug/metabolite transporter (DMT) superfamily n=1 Tax=uncultured Thermomicrobiales bacterium TaxID=1645740 RepID=A0A6J4V370_9BACT|nr:MAG: Permease of the drug/metabolite transporter (DMT) superfamily [uncultured Thermomicrobiales bacterium]